MEKIFIEGRISREKEKSLRKFDKLKNFVYNYHVIFIYCTIYMTEQEVKLQEFKALSVEEKQNKLLAIFEFAKDQFDFSETAINYLSSNTLPDELVMEKLYEFVVYATLAAKERTEKQDEHQRDNAKKLSDEAIKSAQKDSEDADKLLDLINLL